MTSLCLVFLLKKSVLSLRIKSNKGDKSDTFYTYFSCHLSALKFQLL
ncbi:hypothetical protein KL86DYS2_11191 [uncultured Dysgonomonas sp.]|uniref:Uncharacterized protein n=1 Tax=uncultured Dysgonomonas sp. TaxID=206096 RepID=A0A212JC25_9BACT|nr:hypothetical protein KL86DYS2_11191 [uncultured Dysgonomonas sp.]